MDSKVALIIIFNHRYDKNFPFLDKMYGGRFSNIYYIVPFYNGDRKDVIAVYEHSFRFQGYITQALDKFFADRYEHYFFIADDLILNPVINEQNYKEYLKLTAQDSFLSAIINLHERKPHEWWPRIRQAYDYNPKAPGVEIINELPTYDQALELFNKAGLTIKPLDFHQVYQKEKFSFGSLGKKGYLKKILRQVKHRNTAFRLKYPLIGSYSDILVVSGPHMKQFARYCGIFAASDLFVEIAIPTALVLTTHHIKQERDLALQGMALWTPDELKILEPYGNDLQNLLTNFPKNFLYLHPVKLSKWK